MSYFSQSPSPSPAPDYQQQGAGGASQGNAGAGPAPFTPQGPQRYSLMGKLQHHGGPFSAPSQHHHQQQHHQHSFSYGSGAPASPGYGNLQNGGQSHPHSLPHSQHSNSSMHQQGGPLGPHLSQHAAHHPHQPSLGQQHFLGGGGGGGGGPQGVNGSGGGPPGSSHGGQGSNGQPLSQHWQQQVQFANISRQSNSPHHHARAAHLAARGQTGASAAITILDPNRPPTRTAVHSITNGHKKESSGSTRSDAGTPSADAESTRTVNAATARPGSSKELAETSGKDETWTTIDMGGMNLKNVSAELFRYTFLTTLYLPHNSLTTLPTAISKLSQLNFLDLSSNKLSSLPAELGLLTNLRDLFLFDNHLESLPPELGTLYQLETLGIEGNPLPDQIRSLVEKDGTPALISYLRDSCPVPLPPPERDWISIEPDSFPSLNQPPPQTFSALCYNILCDKYATAHMYGYTPSWALAWEYRKELILQEVLNYGSDIICLQEVDLEQYENYFGPSLSAQEYDGLHHSKTRARTMTADEKRSVDGCATFYKNTTFSLVEQINIEFNQIALRRPDFKKTEDMFNRIMPYDNIAVVALLEHRDSGARLIVANVHVHWDPEYKDVKLVQVAMLMDELTKIGDRFARLPPRLGLAEGFDKAPDYSSANKIPVIVCGDLNSEPDSGVYELLSRGSAAKDHRDFMNHVYGNYTSEGLAHPFQLKSAYSHVGELPFTNLTPGFTGSIDHIFYSANALGVTGLLGAIDENYASKLVGLPNPHWPSDHISLLAEFKFR